MFTKKYEFKIGQNYVLNFVRLLGRVGCKFEISSLRCDVKDDRFGVDGMDVEQKYYYRVFRVYATPCQIKKLRETSNILRDYIAD